MWSVRVGIELGYCESGAVLQPQLVCVLRAVCEQMENEFLVQINGIGSIDASIAYAHQTVYTGAPAEAVNPFLETGSRFHRKIIKPSSNSICSNNQSDAARHIDRCGHAPTINQESTHVAAR